MSILAVDIGNSSTTIAAFGPTAVAESRFDIPTRILRHRQMTREALGAPLTQIPIPETIGIASVVPWATDELIVVLHELYPDATILLMTSANIALAIDYPHPEELGIDRLLAALAARAICPEAASCIVIDMGTATTYDCITAEGTFLGGAIAPGIELSAAALTQRTAQLPVIELTFPSSIIGRTTTESMQSGALYGMLAQIEGMIDRLSAAAFGDAKPFVIATGGYSRLLVGRSTRIDRIEPDLVLLGIKLATEISEPVSSTSGEG
jgi:type III pantothenate kinase